MFLLPEGEDITIPTWIDDIEETAEKIKEIADRCGPDYKAICFEVLLKKALEPSLLSKQDAVLSSATSGQSSPVRVDNPSASSCFTDYGLTTDQVTRFIDLESGQILVRNFKTTKKAEIQRKIAALIGLFHLFKENRAFVAKDELIEGCDLVGAYDSKNFSSNMKTATYDGSVIFSKEGDTWKFTPMGMTYAVGVVKELTNGFLSNGTST